MSELNNELKGASICIYGCGECGLQTYLLLREKGIGIRFFSDRDYSKKGYILDGVSCITYDELLQKEKKDITLIVAIAHGEKLVNDFQKLGFEKVFYHEDIKRNFYADVADGCPMEIEYLRKLKQDIEKLALTKEVSVESKRDSILKLIEGRRE